MATGHSVIPYNTTFHPEVSAWLEAELVNLPSSLPEGRFPTRAELKAAILALGYELEEVGDWYVTSQDDFTEIWFKEADGENQPQEIWFRRGDLIVLDIAQKLSEHCGTLIVMNHSGLPTITIVPDSWFKKPHSSLPTDRYIDVLTRRAPDLAQSAVSASTEMQVFLLSQLRQALLRTDRFRQHLYHEAVRASWMHFSQLLNNTNSSVRFLAFDLLANTGVVFYSDANLSVKALARESDVATLTRMLLSLVEIISSQRMTSTPSEPIATIHRHIETECENVDRDAVVRLAAAHFLARAWPGYTSWAVRSVFIDALKQPEHFTLDWYGPETVVEQTLSSIEQLMLQQRIEVLASALPEMTFADDAHEVMRALLDHTFFGSIWPTQMSSLLPDSVAERPHIDPARFRHEYVPSWLYPASATKLQIKTLLPFQRDVLNTVLHLDIPWMVHSNLLEHYGLPPTREQTVVILAQLDD